MIDYGLTGDELLSEVRTVIQREYNDPVLVVALANADYRMQHCNNEYLQAGAFAASIRGMFP
jgi:replication factor C small subunit